MARAVFIVLLLIGAWWSLLLLQWVSIESEGIIGADLNQTMALLPAVAALAILMALYRKLPRVLLVLGSISLIASSSIALTLDLSSSPAVIEARELISGIAGGGEVAITVTELPMIFGITGLVLAAVAGALILTEPRQSKFQTESEELDARELWDEQSE
jgi:chromate transport protein ChrA